MQILPDRHCVICSTWEALSANKKHPIKRSPSPDQLTSPQSPCMYSNPQPTTAIMDANLSLDLSSASIPSFAAPPRISARSPPASHVCCMNSQDGVPVQQHACTPRTAAEKTGTYLTARHSSDQQVLERLQHWMTHAIQGLASCC